MKHAFYRVFVAAGISLLFAGLVLVVFYQQDLAQLQQPVVRSDLNERYGFEEYMMWNYYENSEYGFSFSYPASAKTIVRDLDFFEDTLVVEGEGWLEILPEGDVYLEGRYRPNIVYYGFVQNEDELGEFVMKNWGDACELEGSMVLEDSVLGFFVKNRYPDEDFCVGGKYRIFHDVDTGLVVMFGLGQEYLYDLIGDPDRISSYGGILVPKDLRFKGVDEVLY